jgi:glutathione S-transferase
MSLPILYGHPFSSYTWKVLIPLYENGTAFEFRSVDPAFPDNMPALRGLWPCGKFPTLIEDGRTILESSIIVEWLQHRHPGPFQAIPEDADAALQVRMLDRIFDNHVMTPMNRVVVDAMRPPERRDPVEVEGAKAALETIYGWLEGELTEDAWAAGERFTLADCAAAPSLFYADWVQSIGGAYPKLRAYRARLLARPAVARVVDEARPYRHYFPLGAPDRD